MKPDWAGLIKDHTRPTRDKAAGGNALTLKKGIVGVSIAAGSARRALLTLVLGGGMSGSKKKKPARKKAQGAERPSRHSRSRAA